ncbi:hypothetical protein OQA88_11674 [Cercophora sp. LCS_1]
MVALVKSQAFHGKHELRRRLSPPPKVVMSHTQNPTGQVPFKDQVVLVDIEADVDGDSSYGSCASSSSSLASTIFKYRQENGRTYHPYADYILPNDEAENERLDLQHHIVPPNLRFYIDDISLPWQFSPDEKFDFIHCRMMTGSISDWPALFTLCFDHLTPGGYVEFSDFVFPPLSDDGTLKPNSPLSRWAEYGLECGRLMERELDSATKYKRQLEEAGFVGVVERGFKWPVNGWARDPKLKELGHWAEANFVEGLYGMSVAGFTRFLGWGIEELESFLVDVKKEIGNRRVHAYWPVKVVCAQKPPQDCRAEGSTARQQTDK